MTRDLTNIGDTEFVFTTVEFLDSANAPLSVPVAGRGAIRAAQGDSEKLRDWGDGKRKLMQEGL